MTSFLDGLPPKAKAIAERTDITTAEDVILTPNTKFQAIQGCTENDIRILKDAAAKIVAKCSMPASSLLKPPLSVKWSRISFGCAALDRCTRGGIVTRGITEICGAAGVGKTQLLLQLSLTVQLPKELGGLGKGVAFICTENVFPSKRLFQMAKAFGERYVEYKINFMGNVYIEHVLESDDLLKCVGERLAKVMGSLNIGLIIIDSVAAIFRTYTNYIQRAQDMRKLANYLLQYVDEYNCGVICVNQVSTIPGKEKEMPCLGLAWSHLGRTRIKISRVPKEVNLDNKLLTVRKFEVLYSPETPHEFAEFLITAQGVVDVPEMKVK